MSTIYKEATDRAFDPSRQAAVWPTALKWGAIAGTVGSVLTLLVYNLGYMDIGEDGELPSSTGSFLVSAIVYAGLIYTGMKAYRDGDNGGLMTFGRGMLWSLGFGIALGVVTAIFTLLLYTVLAPDYLAELSEATLDQMAADGMDEASLEATEVMIGYTTSTPFIVLSTLLVALILPLLLGLVVSGILRKEP